MAGVVRWFYQRVIDLAGVYYYLSLPIILVVSVALPLSLAYAALMLPYLNLWLVAVFLIGGVTGVITAISGIRTAFVRIPDEVTGRQLSRHEAKAFWSLLEEVADKVGTRPVDEVWVTPQTDMSVLERGGAIARMKGKERRVLIMGVGLIPDFPVDSLKAVLAHEYAHFQHGDTAGGDVALRVQAAMIRHAEAIERRGVIRSWDIAILYLKYYFRLFNKLTFGASRLQEVLADRRAVEHYGSSAFVAGLGHVVRRDIEFNMLVNEAVSRSIRSDERAVAFYAPSKTLTRDQNESVSRQVRDAYQLPESPGDSHPSLSSRYAAARRMGNDRSIGPQRVVTLFDTTAKRLANEMTRSLNTSVEGEAKLTVAESKSALEHVQAAIETDPTFDLIEYRAVLNYRIGDYEQALDDLDLLLEVLPNDLNTLLSRSNLLATMGDDNRMAKDLAALRKNAAGLPKDVQLDVELRLGAVFAKHGKHADAADAFEQALSIAPESANAVIGRIIAAFKLGQLAEEQTRELVGRLMELCPEDPLLPRITAAAGLSPNRKRSRPSSNNLASRAATRAFGGRVATWGVLATAASLGAVAIYLSWPRGSAKTPVNVASAGESPKAQIDSILDSAIPEIPKVALPKVETPPAETAQTTQRQETEETKKPPKNSGDDRGILSDQSDNVRSELAIHRDLKVTGKRASGFEQSLAGDRSRLTASQESEPEPPTLSPRELAREARRRLDAIGDALRKRERKEGRLLAAQEEQSLSWRVHLLPFLGQEELYAEFDLGAPWHSAANKKLINRIPDIYQFDSSPGSTRFRVMPNDKSLVRANATTESHFAIDGAETTTLAYFVGQGRETVWTRPDTDHFDAKRPLESLGIEPDGLFVALMASGSVRAYENGVHPQKIVALATAEGAETINERTWFSRRRANSPPPRVVAVPKRVKGSPETEVFVRLPRVKSPRIRAGVGKRSSPDPIDTRLRQIGLALHHYHDINRGFPLPNRSNSRDAQGEPLLSWRVHLLPFLDQAPLYKRFRLDEAWDSEHNRRLVELMPAVYGSDRNSTTMTRFLGLAGPHQFFEAGGGLSFRNIADGVSNTIAVVHAGRDKAVPWTKPTDLQLDLQRPQRAFGRVRGPVACLRVDAQVMHLPKKTPAEAWSALATYRGGELIDGETLRRFGEHASGNALVSEAERANDEIGRLKQIVLAMHHYSDGKGSFPANRMHRSKTNQMVPMLSWRVEILPYLGHKALYKQFHRDEPWDSEHNRKLIDFMPDVFRDADDSVDETRTRIQVLTGPGTAYETTVQTGRGPVRRQFTDGISSTILVLQTDQQKAIPWTQPVDLLMEPTKLAKTFGRATPSIGRLVAMADGSVHALSPDTPLKTLVALSTPRGDEVVDDSWRYGN